MQQTKFQTVVNIPEYKWKTGYSKTNMFMGSCFTENIGLFLEAQKYNVDVNPFGILYNPSSVAKGLRILLENKIFQKDDLIEHEGLWHSFYHHGRFSGTNADETLLQINSRLTKSSQTLRNADFLFLTFGTSWIYEYLKTSQTVSNCHKIPASEFKRRRLNVSEIVNDLNAVLTEIWEVNKKIKIIFSVSPIRHLKDGAMENQLSKATLLLAIDHILNTFGSERCAYFPAYEIVMDELRDYRFYSEDMIHLSDAAVNHIRETFENYLVKEDSLRIAKQVQKINKALNHKPFNKFSRKYYKFMKQTLKLTEELEAKFPNLNFELEKSHFRAEVDEIGKTIEQF